MLNKTTVFTIVPLLGVLLYALAYVLGDTWLSIFALLVCLPALFHRFVNGDFLFLLFAVVLIVIGALVFKMPVIGMANGLVVWVLISVIFDLYHLATAKQVPQTLSHEQKAKISEQLKSSITFDTSVLLTKKARLKFKPVTSPVTEHVTKFGGQPVWLEQPQWPLSRSSGKPMRFIGQIALTPELFDTKQAKMAYIFYTDDPDNEIETFEMDGGENAVILQPGKTNIPVIDQDQGDTLQCANQNDHCEFIVDINVEDDKPFIPQHISMRMEKKALQDYDKTIQGNKIGGTPYFLQGDEFPQPGAWQLLLQLHNEPLPFDVNFGMGCAYAFINTEGTEAKFFWQS